MKPASYTKNLTPSKIALGEALFHDTILSSNYTISCASCHITVEGGDDNQRFSVGVTGAPSTFNSPSIFNLAGHVSYFWDGRSVTLDEQLADVLHNPNEMGLDWSTAIKRLNADPAYTEEFENLYGSKPDQRTITDAIVSYELSLVAASSPFDQYLAGDKNAISKQAKNGVKLFTTLGCISCHQGPLLGGNLYQKIGVFNDFRRKPEDIRPEDLGRFNVTGNPADKFYFKVPSLRNVAVTAPYFHDGSRRTLQGAVGSMAYLQLGVRLSDSDKDDIVAFLETLTSDRLQHAEKHDSAQ